MATKLFLRTGTQNGIGSFRDMLTTAGDVGTDTAVVNTAASGTQIQWTHTAGGAVAEWISGRVPVGGFTLSGTMTFSIWANESNMNANCGARARVFKRTAAGVETEVGGGPWNDGVEFGTGSAEMVWTGTPTSTAYAENDRIIVRYYITNVGTMASGHTCTLTYSGPDATSGDSFFQINENVAFKADTQPGNASGAFGATVSLSAFSGSAAGRAAGSGAFGATVSLSALGGSASGRGAASGAFGDTVTAVPFTGSATGFTQIPGNASGAFGATVSLSAPTGSATGRGSASGGLTTVTISPPTGSATGRAAAAGGFGATINLTAPTGSATGRGSASGSLSTVTISPPTGSATGRAAAAGGFGATVNLTAPTGSATGRGSASGSLSTVTISPPTGSATGRAAAAGGFGATVTITEFDGSATGRGAGSGAFGATIGVTAFEGTASGDSGSEPGNASGAFGATINLSAFSGSATGRGGASGAFGGTVTISAPSGDASGKGHASGAFGNPIIVTPFLAPAVAAEVPGRFIVFPTVRSRIIGISRQRMVVPLCRARMIGAQGATLVIEGITTMSDLTIKKWVSKRSTEDDWRGVNWRTELAEGETIVTYGFEIPEESTLTLVNTSILGTKAHAHLSGGTPSEIVDIVAYITTNAVPTRRLEVLVKLPIT